ncbi:CLUMA_CG014466, isoform A [Clunio marinus]|uniref:CLUMA_CG014466, isoform A n=1 Tax=Clunio marinus TaxID=568069 RepID=A0A1J1INT6_9DIPT|nr:CLUMA_CG014466, isoform A [Clunio marinus]
MNYEILETLNSIGYEGKLLDENVFSEAISEGFENEDFRNLIIWITNEISLLGKLDEKITHDSDISNFKIELSGFLKELQCSYEALSNDSNINNRMQTIESRYLLIEFLIGELMTLKMLSVTQVSKDKGNVITIHESSTAAALKDIAITLNLGKPPENISPDALFNKISTKLDETLKVIPNSEKRIGNALFTPKKPLNNAQWIQLEKIQAALEEEYNMRRKVLMTRLDVTIQSFKWSEKIKGKEKFINERYMNKSQVLDKLAKGGQRTDIPSLLAARDKLAIIEKTSSANVRKNTKSKLQRHIIGKVPDRGGRTLELQRPPPEMPSWQKRQPGSDNRGGGRGGGGGNKRGNFNQNRGNFNQQSGGFPPQQYQQKAPYNPSNQQSFDDNYESHNSGNFNNRGQGSRVQGGWNQRGGGRGRR